MSISVYFCCIFVYVYYWAFNSSIKNTYYENQCNLLFKILYAFYFENMYVLDDKLNCGSIYIRVYKD